MPANPGNPGLPPIRRLQRRLYRQYQFDVGSPQVLSYPTGMLVQLVRRPRTIGTKVSYKLGSPTTAVPAQPPSGGVIAPLGALALQVPRRPAHYKLSPPAVVTPASQPPVVTTLRVSLAKQRLRVGTISTLGAPVVVNPAPPVVTKLRVTLAPSPRQGRWSGYGLAPPAIVDISPAPPLRVSLALQKLNRRKTISVLRAPVIIGPFVPPAPPFAPVRVELATLATITVRRAMRQTQFLAAPTALRSCPILLPQTPGSLSLATLTAGSLSLPRQSAGSLTLAARSAGSQSLAPLAPGTLTLTPKDDGCC